MCKLNAQHVALTHERNFKNTAECCISITGLISDRKVGAPQFCYTFQGYNEFVLEMKTKMDYFHSNSKVEGQKHFKIPPNVPNFWVGKDTGFSKDWSEEQVDIQL